MNNVSVIIPTRNRIKSLGRALKSIYNQTLLPKEIIIIDSSDNKLTINKLPNCPKEISISIIHSKPSVCKQRNIGINKSSSDYILLCDDDIEFDRDYIATVKELFKTNKLDVISGLVLEKDNKNQWTSSNNAPKTIKLLYAYIFGLPLYCNIVGKLPKGFINRFLIRRYKANHNHITKAGWPVMTQMESPSFTTTIYGIGAAMFKSVTLKNNKYDPAFYHRGIGDNYDLAIRINSRNGILVTTQTKALHYKEPSNRFKKSEAYYYRGLALFYILTKSSIFNWKNKIYFIWSLLGDSFLFLVTGRLAYFKANARLILSVVFRKKLYKNHKE